MKPSPEERARRLCLTLPESSEKPSHGRPSFWARGKMFAMFMDNHHGDERVALWLKAAPGVQAIVVGADPKRFFVPPYVGPSGWIGVRVDLDPDWHEVAEHVRAAHQEASIAGRGKRAPAAKRAQPRKPARKPAQRRRGR